ncbi:inositol-3-phosphate synthase [Candidatus Marsarchaeota archaeon]|jgi:myo-inositol-1-phosphate synthase|nr:inositol-3-phosphate synthase [Candidatus Marsarchaeota archaeon]MCL5092190.1 inositol-3-phosphate synthase [Candidatus Marsarchaeota archaeon]
MPTKKEVRIGIIGLGNVAAGLIQGIEYYKTNPSTEQGLMHKVICSYGVGSVKLASAFDISSGKVGKSVDAALYSSPNLVNWLKIPKSAVSVKQGPRLDSVGKYVENLIKPVKERPINILENEIISEINNSGTTVLVNLLPVGSQRATEFWAGIALKTKCAFVNSIPVFIASNKTWAKRFKESKVPLVGDDMKGLIGSTIVHRILTKLTQDRGTTLINTYQINIGGNTDFKNMLERERLTSKKISKTDSVQSQLHSPLKQNSIHIGPSDFVEFLGNTKIAYMYMHGLMWGGRPYEIDVKLEVDDKANAGGILIDAIRLAKVAQDRRISGALIGPSAYLMKHPPVQYSDDIAQEKLEAFIDGKSNDK